MKLRLPVDVIGIVLLLCYVCNIFSPICCQVTSGRTDSSLLTKEKSTFSPCHICKTFVSSFTKGMERTARGKFEGGDAAWEEERLGSYSNSEVRLVEIQEKLCVGIEKGEDQCHTLAEETEQIVEDWWFRKQKENPDLHEYLCINHLQVCCPDKHFGATCKPCPGFPDNVCFNNGKCKGSGTRKGSGQCACDEGYAGDQCSQCAPNFYTSYQDPGKVLCSPCHVACQDSCSQAGPKSCSACKSGWVMDTEQGCFDVNECAQKNICKESEFCVNSDGSFSCLACDRACASCHGDGPDMCDKCSEGYKLKGNLCINDNEAGRDAQVGSARYFTYLGLCVATCIIFQKNTVVASLIGLCVALYITISEYMLNSPGGKNQDLGNLFLPS